MGGNWKSARISLRWWRKCHLAAFAGAGGAIRIDRRRRLARFVHSLQFPVICFRFLILLFVLQPGMALADEVIRIMAANTTSGNGQDYDLGHGNRIFQGLDPDIALVQELNYLNNTPTDLRSWVDANFGTGFSYFREPAGNIPNGIVSRYPILASGEWDDSTMTDRDYVWARIDIPGDKDLWAVSVHLSSGGGATQRNVEAGEIRGFIQARVPAADYLVLGGDFNTNTRTETCVTTLSSVVITSGPYPVDLAGDPDTNAAREKPYDWVTADADLHARRTTLVIGSRSFPDGLVFDSRVYTPLSEVSPVLSGDSGATNMQHMAVMRAFLIPTNAPPVIAQGAAIPRTISQNNFPTAFAASLSATDAEGHPLSWTISSAPAHGTAIAGPPATGANVSLSYTPANDFVGSDSFIIRVSDGQGGTDQIIVNVTVIAVPAIDAWTFDKFAPLLPANQATVWALAADPDGDGYTNLEEFAYDLDPALKDAAPNPMQISGSPGATVLSFLMRMDGGVPALSYTLETSALSGAWVAITPSEYTLLSEIPVSTSYRRRTLQLNSGQAPDRAFYRLRINR